MKTGFQTGTEDAQKSASPRKTVPIRRGDIYYADLSPVVGSEQGGLRPVLIIQNDVGNRYSPTVIAAAITSQLTKAKLPTHIDVYADRFGLAKDSVILLEQIRTIDKRRLKEKMGHLDDSVMTRVNEAISVSIGLGGDRAHAGQRYTEEEPAVQHNPGEYPAVGDLPTELPAAEMPAVKPLTVAASVAGSGTGTTMGTPMQG